MPVFFEYADYDIFELDKIYYLGEFMKKDFVRVDEKGMSITGKWKKGIFSLLFSRLVPIVILLIIHIFIVLFAWAIFGAIIQKYIIGGIALFVLIGIVILINSNMDNSSKLSWILLITLNPFIGLCFYYWTRRQIGLKRVKENTKLIDEEERNLLPFNDKDLNEDDKALANYLYTTGPYPIFKNSDVKYFSLGEDKFKDMLAELKRAEKFIFLEYFIVEEGYMWGQILQILASKVLQGVEVRVMYDGGCELATLPFNYPDKLESLGIKCRPWNRVKPLLTSAYNYRDHRKILVIDGKVAFNGGVNLADEYINKKDKYGHWKDTAIKVKGEAVKSYTAMFLGMWNADMKEIEDISKYINIKTTSRKKGLVLPYGDSPLDEDKAGEMVYIDILNKAKDYVYIMTPYLILDGELESALCFAAKKGIDVRIMMPGIPDKRLVWYLGKSYYPTLINAGVKIYEYTPGFVHAKVFVSDDKKAVVGTINLDYRSLYHHYECATYLSEVECINDIKEDYLNTLLSCQEISLESISKQKASSKIVGSLLRLIAPML